MNICLGSFQGDGWTKEAHAAGQTKGEYDIISRSSAGYPWIFNISTQRKSTLSKLGLGQIDVANIFQLSRSTP